MGRKQALGIALPADEPEQDQSDQDACNQPINEIRVHAISILAFGNNQF
jgi:hypothetical protein